MNYSVNRFSVAPMLDYTNRHCRYFHRLLTKKALLYTEMVATGAILHAQKNDFLKFDIRERPVALQLGGSDPKELAWCARKGEIRGYAEINLNVGCPSNKVQHANFGACLLAQAKLVAECVAAMRMATSIPISIKTRIGVDQHDSYSFLADFIDTVATKGGCSIFILHARKAWLSGLSPKENRTVPPLDYARVYQIKKDFPELTIVINGEIATLQEAQCHLQKVDGVMLGRQAYYNPNMLRYVDSTLFEPDTLIPSYHEIIEQLCTYIQQELQYGTPLHRMIQPIQGLFRQIPGAKRWRRYLTEYSSRLNADLRVIRRAFSVLLAQD